MHPHKKISGYLHQIVDALTERKTNTISRLLERVCATPEPWSIVSEVRYWLEGEGGKTSPRVPKKHMEAAIEAMWSLIEQERETIARLYGNAAIEDGAFIHPEHVGAAPPEEPAQQDVQASLADIFDAPDETLPAVASEELPSPVEIVVLGTIGNAPIVQWVEGIEIRDGCFYADMPNEAYHAMAHASNSRLSRVAKSPAHARYEPPRKQTPAMRLGSAIHTAILEPDTFDKRYILLPDVDDRRRSEYKEAAKYHDPDCILVGSEAAHVAGMQLALYSDAYTRSLLEAPGHRELSGFSVDPVTGARCRFRFDALITEFDGNPVMIGLDLKKTRDASDDEVSRSVANYRYHVQAAFYCDQFFWMTGLKIDAWAFLFIEEDPPHAASVHVLDDDAMQIGRLTYARDLAIWQRCVVSGDWYTYDTRPRTTGLPAWAMKKAREEFNLDPIQTNQQEPGR